MDQLTRAVAWASMLTALLATAWVNAVTIPLFGLSVGSFVLALALGLLRPRVALALALVSVYLAPAVFRVLAGHNAYAYVTPWIAAIVGAMAATSRSAWSVPGRWRWPLVTWALLVAVSWPLVAWRELDYGLMRLAAQRLPNAGVKISPAGAVAWVTQTALIQLFGLIWLDWLFGRYSRQHAPSFKKEIVTPLAIGILVACSVAIYQSVVDINFASGHVWPSIHRAAGTLMDANVFGTLAALWGPVFLVLGFGHPRFLLAAGVAFLMTCAGVWTSASRTALLTAAFGVAIAAASLRSLAGGVLTRRRVLVGIAVMVLVVVAFAAVVPLGTTTAIQRNSYLLPSSSWSSVKHTVHELWDRDGYGSAAVAMIQEFPLAGVGVGCFHLLAHDFQMEASGTSIPPDNAQNWFRHQLAEYGMVGSIGWIVWVFAFAPQLWSARGRVRGPTRALRGPIIAFAFASLLGMPGQDAAVALTFWLLVFWYSRAFREATVDEQRSPKWAWIAMLTLVSGFAAIRAVPNDLRPPFRAARFNYPYSYGVDFENPAQVWTAKHGVTVLQAADDWMKLTVWVNHPDADKRPVHGDVWTDHDHIINDRLRLRERVTRYVHVGKGNRFVLEAEVDRTFRPSDVTTSPDQRDLGLAMKWEFAPSPPR